MSIIGKLTKARGTFGDIKATTKVVKSKKVYDRKKAKAEVSKHEK